MLTIDSLEKRNQETNRICCRGNNKNLIIRKIILNYIYIIRCIIAILNNYARSLRAPRCDYSHDMAPLLKIVSYFILINFFF